MSTRLALLGPATAPWSPISSSAQEQSATAGDQALDWDAQMRRHGRRVVVALLARGIPLERAKELAQDAWLRVIQNHRAGKLEELQIPGVVITQADFLARDDRRRATRRHERGMDPNPVNPDAKPAPADFEARLAARQQLRKVEAVLEAASPNARQVFFMTYGSDARPAAEIAQVLGLSVQRVRQIACELRQRIRREIGGQ